PAGRASPSRSAASTQRWPRASAIWPPDGVAEGPRAGPSDWKWGPRHGPQPPPPFGAPRRSRGAPRSQRSAARRSRGVSRRAKLPRAVGTLLDVVDLQTHFVTRGGVVRAVDGVSWDVAEGETVALVGESGCGKSVSALSVMRLVAAPAGRIVSGQVFFKGRDLLALSEEEMRRVRGREIAMVFQEPMTSLNPVLTIGRQLTEGLEIHLGMTREGARQRA